MATQRVISLAPSTTRIITQLGVTHKLVGVTNLCELPQEHEDNVNRLGGWTTPAVDRIVELQPDVIFTSDALQRETRDALHDDGYRVTHTEPTTVTGMLESITTIATTLDVVEAGVELRECCEQRIRDLRASVPVHDVPVVYCEEWMDPPMAAGNWVPEVVEIAGGSYPLVPAGERSREVSRNEIEKLDPDYVILHVCGRGKHVKETSFTQREWDVDAHVAVIDDTLLNEPSPMLIDGITYLAELFHGSPPWDRRPPTHSAPF